MAQIVPQEFANSQALQFCQSQGWNWKAVDNERIELEFCPYKDCAKGGYGHFYVVCTGDKRDGLYICHRCGKSGNTRTLKEYLGLAVAGVSTPGDYARGAERTIEPMPDMAALHDALLEDEQAMDYLMNTRGFSRAGIERAKIGLTRRSFRECGEVKAIVYPYWVADNCVFWHYRTLPPAPKAFNSPKGWDAPLYNGQILREGLLDLVMVEGEANCIAAMDKGIENICGVPGANFKKTLWIETLDQVAPERIYICYDKDSVGQKAAQTLASKIGIERCYKIILPDFTVPQEDGTTKQGKDLNEWFVYGGGTIEAFEALKKDAVLFDVQGVISTNDALDELEEQLNGKESLMPKYLTAWKPLNKLIGFEEGDIIDIVAPEKIGKTTFGMNLMEHMVDMYNEDGIIICMEMPNVRMARKWVAHVTRTPDIISENETEAKKTLQAMKTAVEVARYNASNRSGTLYFCYPPHIKDVEDMYKLIRECIRRYGVKWVMVDNLQLLCDRTLKNAGHRTIHLSQISKTLAGIAKDYNVQLVRILQPHRIRDGAMITTDDVDGSSHIAKDCDCMITLHRNRVGELSANDFQNVGYIETQSSFDKKMLVTVGLSRYSSGGYITLDYDGPTSTVNEYDVAGIAAIKAATTPVGYAAQMSVLQPDAAVAGIAV